MDILVKVKIPQGQRAKRHYVDGVINLKNMTMCMPHNSIIDNNATIVYFTSGESQLIQVKYENFITLLERLYGEKFIEMKDDG